MKMGPVNRMYERVRSFFTDYKERIKLITLAFCVLIALVVVVYMVTDTHGSVHKACEYSEDAYEQLSMTLLENIGDDPYMDLKNIEQNWECTYSSEKDLWTVTIEQEAISVKAEITYTNGESKIDITYKSKAEHYFGAIVGILLLVILFTGCAYICVLILTGLGWALLKGVALTENLIFIIKKKWFI